MVEFFHFTLSRKLLNPLWFSGAYMTQWDCLNYFIYFYFIFLSFFNVERKKHICFSVPLNLRFQRSIVQSHRSMFLGQFGALSPFSSSADIMCLQWVSVSLCVISWHWEFFSQEILYLTMCIYNSDSYTLFWEKL